MNELIIHPEQFQVRAPGLTKNRDSYSDGYEYFNMKFISQPPRQQLIRLLVDVEPEAFLLHLPWVHYEWINFKDRSYMKGWVMNGMYFSPQPLSEDMHVSLPSMSNFYGNAPCEAAGINIHQKDCEDPRFSIETWQGTFNSDGHLTSRRYEHPVWDYLTRDFSFTEFIGEMRDKAEGLRHFYAEWEKLTPEEVLLKLPWPQDILLPQLNTDGDYTGGCLRW